jgi:hypothetical protein
MLSHITNNGINIISFLLAFLGLILLYWHFFGCKFNTTIVPANEAGLGLNPPPFKK